MVTTYDTLALNKQNKQKKPLKGPKPGIAISIRVDETYPAFWKALYLYDEIMNKFKKPKLAMQGISNKAEPFTK